MAQSVTQTIQCQLTRQPWPNKQNMVKSWHLPVQTEESHRNLSHGSQVTHLRLKLGTSWIQVRTAIAWTNLLNVI